MDTQPSTHYHSQFVRDFNFRMRGQEQIDLSVESLLAAARKETGLAHYGDESFLPAMGALLASLEAEANLNPFGRFVAKSRIDNTLKNRLWADACFAAHPEIRQRRLTAPIVIIGPHRSGTTRLHSMMATDTGLRHLKAWQGINPAPRLGQQDMGVAARYNEVKQMLDARAEIYPGAYLAHPMRADWPEEEMLLLNHSFCGFTPLGLYHVPGYYRWFLGAEKGFAYRTMTDLMKLISWSQGEAEDKPWILKNPQHMLDLEVLLASFPDAKLVFTHRDPLKTVGSTLSLMWFYTVQHTDEPCRAQVRDIWLDFCEQAARRCMRWRENIPAPQQLDVHYEAMNRDWRGVMRRIYDFAGIEFSTAAEQAMVAWLDASHREKTHGGHRYTLEDFGTSRAEVDARMMFARERYAIPYEDR
jgi:hypothetical protein